MQMGTCGSYHEGRQVISVFFGLFFEVNKVQASILQTLHWHDLQTSQYGGLNRVNAGSRKESKHTYRGIRSVGANRNQANITMTFTARLVVRSNYTKPSIFACSPRIRLQRARVEASDVAEVRLQLLPGNVSRVVHL